MSDDPIPPQEDGASTPVLKEEGSLNTSMITIIVDDTHFRFGSHFFSESETLKAIIATSETDSIRLQNTTAAQAILKKRMYDDYKLSNAELKDLLLIARTYGLKRVYRHSVDKMLEIFPYCDPVRRVLLAKQFNLKQWLAPALAALCTRTNPINVSEAEKLGINTCVTLAKARESFHRDCLPRTTKDRALSVTNNLRCCGYSPSQLHDGPNGAKICPVCEQIVIPGPGIQPAFTNDNRHCCGTYPFEWEVDRDGSSLCLSCSGIVLPAVVTGNLCCCGNGPYKFTYGTNGAKICPDCRQVVIPGPGGADFTNNNRRCCDNPPSSWISHPDASEACPSCKGITLPCQPGMSVQERALRHVKRVFGLV